MASPRLLLALTVANVTLLGWQLVRPSRADSGEALGVLRGRGLELVDEAGRLRVQVKIEPGDPDYRWPDSTRKGYPETVIFRLITADGKPRVKLTTSEDGSGLLLLGSTDETRSVLHAEGAQTTLMLRSKAGVERVLGP